MLKILVSLIFVLSCTSALAQSVSPQPVVAVSINANVNLTSMPSIQTPDGIFVARPVVLVGPNGAAVTYFTAGSPLSATTGTFTGALNMNGGNLLINSGYSLGLSDGSSGTTTYFYQSAAGLLNMVSTSGAVELDLTSVLVASKVYLDSSHSAWIQETGGKVVIANAQGNLFSINLTSGNTIAKGTAVSGGNP